MIRYCEYTAPGKWTIAFGLNNIRIRKYADPWGREDKIYWEIMANGNSEVLSQSVKFQKMMDYCDFPLMQGDRVLC